MFFRLNYQLISKRKKEKYKYKYLKIIIYFAEATMSKIEKFLQIRFIFLSFSITFQYWATLWIGLF